MYHSFLQISKLNLFRYWPLVVVFLVSIFWSPFDYFTYIATLALSIAIGRSFNLNRPNIHWRGLPLSFRHWLISHLILLVVLIVMPAAIRQGIIMQSVNLGQAHIMALAMVQQALVFFAIALTGFVISALSSTLMWLVCNSICCLLPLMLGFLLGSDTSFHDINENSPSLVPRASFWWLAIAIIFPLLLSCVFLARFRRHNRMAAVIGILGLIIYSFFAGYAIDGGGSLKMEPLQSDEQIVVTQGSGEKSQQLFKDIGISGLPKAHFVSLSSATLYDHSTKFSRNPELVIAGKEIWDLDKQGRLGLFWNQRLLNSGGCGINTLISPERILLRGDATNIFPSGFTLGLDGFDGHAIDFLNDINKGKLRVFGQIYEWVEYGDLAFKNGTHQLPGDISFSIDLVNVSSDEIVMETQLYRPRLSNTSKVKVHKHEGRWHPTINYLLLAENELLNEVVILGARRWEADDKKKKVNPIFKLYEKGHSKVQMLTDPRWRILWPEDSRLVERWLSGSRLKVMIPEYRGQLDQVIDYQRIQQ